MPTGDACLPGAPPAYSTEVGSAFRREAEAVYEASRSLTAAQREIALYWADGPGATSTPPGHWWELAGQLASERKLDLATAARLYGALGVTVADAFISCWNAKYKYGTLRPETYIQRTLDASWKPLLTTPPFPEYSSGHSTVSSAASEVMAAFFGARTPFTDRVHVALEMTPRTFGSFADAAEEAAASRLYGGIHYPMGNRAGLTQGACVSSFVREAKILPEP